MAAATTTKDKINVSELYKSFPLPPNSKYIRLLEVHPDLCLEGSGPIKVNLHAVDLEERPSFSALSYVWGNDIKPCTITCGAFTVKVTENCHSALQNLRKRLGRFTIWIDAICINQDDDSEKAQQILLMERIYSGAEIVYVWLGEGNARSDRAIAYLARAGFLEYLSPDGESTGHRSSKSRVWAALWSLITSLMNVTSHPFPTDGPDWLLRFLHRLRIRTISRAAYTSYDDLADLLDREWIKRMWTYQEILLASNPVVVCGDSHLQWSRLAWSIIFLGYPGINDRGGVPRIFTLTAWTRVAFSRGRITAPNTSWLANRTPSHFESSHLTGFRTYQNFIHDVFRKYTLIRTLASIAQGLCLFIVMGFIILVPIMSKWSSHSHSVIITRLYVGFLSTLVALVFIFLLSSVRWMTLRFPRVKSAFQQEIPTEDLVDGITSRKARDPRDKAFALQAILQKLSKDDLPVPDYTCSVGQIYKELCVQLIQATGSLHLLLPAALNSCPGQPSWIPDWSKEFSNLWLDRLLTTDSKSNVVRGSQPFWKWDPNNSDTLTIRGCQLGSISSCFKFQNTMDDYLESETAIHLENLRNMLAFSNVCGSWQAMELFILYFAARNENVVFHLPSPSQLRAWGNFIHYSRQKTPSEILSLLKREGSETFLRSFASGIFTTPHREILRAHISVCNYLAETRQTFFVCKEMDKGLSFSKNPITGSIYKEHEGICTNDVQVGDKVMFISGLSSLLIVRGDRGSTQLISPAIIGRIHESEEDLNWRGEFNLQGEDLEEYILS